MDLLCFRMDTLMEKNCYFLVFLLSLLSMPSASAFWWPWSSETSDQKIERLQKKLEKHPHDPAATYNVGVAQYHANKFALAQKSFATALQHIEKNKTLEQQCLFNAASSALQHTHALLPEAWENKTIDSSVLDQALATVKQSLEWLKKFRSHDPENKKAKEAEEYAKKLLKKLEEKKKQQEQKKDEQQEKQEQEKNKEQENQQNKQDQQQNKDQEQKQQQQQQEQNNESQEQPQQSQGKENKEPNEPKGNERQGEGDQKDQSEKPKEDATDGEDQKSGADEKKETEQDEMEKDHDQHPQPSPEEATPSGEEKQASEQIGQGADGATPQETAEMKGLRAVLENLQADESKIQKKIMMHQTKDQNQQPTSNQKPW
jgi:hypothetical protein